MGTKMKLSKFIDQAILASENLFSFAEFTKNAEYFFDDNKLHPEFISLYKEKWFELEIVNAVALEDWESEGRPKDWKEKWDVKYKKDASDVIQEIVKVVRLKDDL
jgi:hypothetical protein